MAGSIGAVECSRVIGHARPQATRVQTWQIPGIDGYGAHLLGAGNSESQFVAVAFGRDTVISGVIHLPTWYDALRATQGTIVTVTNEIGHAFSNQLILEVSDPIRRTANDLNNITARFQVNIRTVTV